MAFSPRRRKETLSRSLWFRLTCSVLLTRKFLLFWQEFSASCHFSTGSGSDWVRTLPGRYRSRYCNTMRLVTTVRLRPCRPRKIRYIPHQGGSHLGGKKIQTFRLVLPIIYRNRCSLSGSLGLAAVSAR